MGESGSHCCPPLNLQTLYNVRDLGGHNTLDAKTTRCGRFLRADAPVSLSRADQALLLSYPIRHIIDLRSQSEVDKQPNMLRNHPDVKYENIPLLGKDLEQDLIRLQKKNSHRGFELVDLYVHILDQSQSAIGKVLLSMAWTSSVAVLFHCTHGKDRTGIITALLLRLAGVDEEQVIEDYRISEARLDPWFSTFIADIPEADRRFFITPPRYMRQTLQHLAGQYGTVQDYLLRCGLTCPDQELLRKKLLDP